MPDVDGKMESYCDCAKGWKSRVNIVCLHIRLVTDHPNEFGDVIHEGEEPEAFIICVQKQSLIFSVAQQSGSARHHSHKRTIVSNSKRSWICQSCVKEPYYFYYEAQLNLVIAGILKQLRKKQNYSTFRHQEVSSELGKLCFSHEKGSPCPKSQAKRHKLVEKWVHYSY